MLAANLGETIKNFFTTGNNLWIVIAIAVAIVALIVIIVVSAPKKKKNAANPADKEAETSGKDGEGSEAEKGGGPESVTVEEKKSGAVIAEVSDPETRNKGTESEKIASVKEKTAATEENAAEQIKVESETGAAEAKSSAPIKKAKPKTSGAERAEKTEEAKTKPKSSEKPSVKKAVGPSAEDETAASVSTAEAFDDASYEEAELTEEDGKESRPGTVEIYKDARGEFHFRFRSMNGSIVGHSQAYKSKESCKNGIRSVVNCCEDVIIADTTKKDSDYVQTIGRAAFEIYRDSAGQFRYRLVAKNASNVLASQGYTSKTNCIKGAESIIRMSKNHVIEDETLVRKKKDAE